MTAPIRPDTTERGTMGMPRMIRRPWLTLGVFAVTATVNLIQLTVDPRLLRSLERTSAGLHSDWWRTFASLFVQDGGVLGTLSNLVFLLVLGAVAESVTSRPRWLLAYFGTGLIGELAGYSWQPTGGGNSVAVCGLAAVLAWALVRRPRSVPAIAAPATLVWCGVLFTTWYVPLVVLGAVPAAVTPRLIQARWGGLGFLVLGVCVATAVTLTAARNIHGAALLAGLLLAAALTWREKPGPVRGSRPLRA
ncbi:hypothetical protein Ani05nite_08800 [Amorphoplanes nipponensis]|uniref:Peptidase S54 rhomboid domain-containing protein n=1 Tax=Actinoplanes nipponensis TaxID=135950 RepID=A0A919MJD6_9ACTN|nr:rhomboid family intramembrane serine protease [Actinoplanes nipponensis]GIE47346.1 hypothetical protein Ani05nite_08800 [Actinoplanes nipponensis]